MNKREKIAYNCRKATLLIEKRQLSRLTIGERVELKLHLTGCSMCRMFEQQSETINKMITRLFEEKAAGRQLDNDFKQSLQDKINLRFPN